MSPAGVAFILIILVVTASVFITVSNMNKTVQELSNTISSISAELNTIKQAINMPEEYRALLNLLVTLSLERIGNYIIYKVSGVGAGDVLAPHLYDWSLDGVDDYLLVKASESLNITNTITIALAINIQPGVNIKGILSRGTWWGPWLIEFNYNYNSLVFKLGISSSEHTVLSYSNSNLYLTTNHLAFTGASGEYIRMYLNGTSIAETTFPYAIGTDNNDIYIGRHSWGNPINAINSYLLIYNASLGYNEIQQLYNNKLISSAKLRLFLDATFFNGTHYIDLSSNGNHAIPYNGVDRVKASETWVWTLRNATADPGVWLRFFPKNTLIVYRTGEIEKITSTEYYTNRTDIMLIMIPKEAIG